MREIKLRIISITSGGQPHLGAFALVLGEEGGYRRLPIIIGAIEAQAIMYELQGAKPPRPMTHDMAIRLIESLGASLEKIVIKEVTPDGTFLADIYLKNEKGEIRKVDARPSDSIALAVRKKAPIYVVEDVLNEAGVTVTQPLEEKILSELEKIEEKAGKVSQPFQKDKEETLQEKLVRLRKELEEAIDNEDFERAAWLRDEISKLEDELNK